MRVSEPAVTWRDAKRGELGLLLSMERRCFKDVDRFSRRMIAHYLRNPNRSVIVHVIEAHAEPVGYSVLLGRKGRAGLTLHSICVLPDREGRGVARDYLSGVMSMCRGDITLRVRRSNERALGLYRDLGFEREGVDLQYYGDGEDAIMMRWRPKA